MLAMALHPDAQSRAQAQIDAIVGRQRPPRFSDRKDLPYIGALINETLRWRTVGPLSIPTRSTQASILQHNRHFAIAESYSVVQDDWYNGYLIPKGSMVVCNVWLDSLPFLLHQGFEAD